MLSLEKPLVVDGISVFRDHADTSRFWYLPGRVALARRSDGAPALSLLTYRPAEAGGVQRGGGYMMFEATLELPKSTLSKIASRVSAEPGVELPISLAPPPFENGAVQCIALDLQGSGGTTSTPAPEGAFRATEHILGATVPTMDAANRAAFNLVLSQEGAIIMEQALKEGLTPVGVVYSLQYLAMRPALDVTITAHLEQVYTGLTAGLEGQYMYVKVGLEAALEWLRATGAIEITVHNFTGEQDEKDQEKWALQLFTDHLLDDWFTPTLAPGKLPVPGGGGTPIPGGGGTPSPGGGGTPTPGGGGTPTPGGGGTPTPGGGGTPNPGSGGTPSPGGGGTPTPGGGTPSPGGGTPAGGGTPTPGGGTPSSGGGTPAPGGGTPGGGTSAPGGGSKPAVPPPPGAASGVLPAAVPTSGVTAAIPPAAPAAAVLQQQSTAPNPLPAGFSVTHTPAATGTTETLRITGAGAHVRLAGQEVSVQADGTVTRNVNPGESVPVSVTWDAPGGGEIFCLFFDMDKPAENGWSTQPPSTEFRSYVENSTTDPRFRSATGIQQMQGDGAWTGPEQGADRLARWIAQLPAPQQVEVRGYASHEHATPQADPVRAAYNMRLSRRRLDVAAALVRRAGGDPVVQEALGDTVAAARPGSHGPFGGDPDNRVAQIRRHGGGSGASWSGVLQRAADANPGGGGTPNPGGGGTPNPGGGTPNPGGGGTPNPGGGTPNPGGGGTPNPGGGGTPNPGGGGTPNPGGGGTPKPGELPTLAAFKLRFVRQEERRELTLRYQRSEAVRQTLAPQGFVGILAGDLSAAEKVVTLIDLDHRFFRELDVTARMPGEVSDLGLTEAHLSIDYGPADHVRHGDLVFTPQGVAPQTFTTFLDDALTMSYDARLDLTFDATAGWEGDALRYSIPLPGSTDRDVVINPHEHLDLRTYTIEPGNVDWDVVDAIDVQLSAQGYGDHELRHLVTLRKDTPAQRWRLRGGLPAPAGRGVSVAYRQTLTDGTVERTDPIPVDLSLVRVDDLFTDALDLVLVPAFPSAGVDRVIVDIEYHSAQPVAYDRVLRHELPGTATEPLRLHIALRDPSQREYRVRFTFTGPGLFDQRAFVTTSEEVIPIR